MCPSLSSGSATYALSSYEVPGVGRVRAGAGMTEQKVRWGILATGGIAAAFTADLVDLPDA